MEKRKWRKIYDLDKNWIGMKYSEIMSSEQAEKLGYPKKPKLVLAPRKPLKVHQHSGFGTTGCSCE